MSESLNLNMKSVSFAARQTVHTSDSSLEQEIPGDTTTASSSRSSSISANSLPKQIKEGPRIIPEEDDDDYDVPINLLMRSSSRHSTNSTLDRRKSSHQYSNLLEPNLDDLEMQEDKDDLKKSTADNGEVYGDDDERQQNWWDCKSSNYSIKTQLMLTFGTANALTIIVIMIICLFMIGATGASVASTIGRDMNKLSNNLQGKGTRYLAEDLAVKLIPEDLVQIIYEATKDRFMGYPNRTGYDKDKLVPFRDTKSKSNKYPIKGEPVPLDWGIKSNVNETNYVEHVGSNRWEWYRDIDPSISTATASYYMQGICDPSALNESINTYFPLCTKHNNNIGTGGVIAPTPTNFQIHRKVSDLTPLFKSLYEYHTEVRSLGLYFANGGSGATYQFPHFQLDTRIKYVSDGCDWLLDTPHPLDSSRTIIEDEASKERIQDEAICREKGTLISSRLYNPLEREWCRDQAMNPNQVRVSGPYLDALHEDLYLLTAGKAIYDPLTSEFLACIAVDFGYESLHKLFSGSRMIKDSKVSIVRYDDIGTVVASSEWNTDKIAQEQMQEIKTIDQIPGAGVSKQAYQHIQSLVNYEEYKNMDKQWDAKEIHSIYENFAHDDDENGYYITGFPIPLPPDSYDPDYVPVFMVLVSVEKASSKVQEAVDVVIENIKDAAIVLTIFTVIINMASIGVLLVCIVFVSHYLTSPLQYMNDVANDIIEKHFHDDHHQLIKFFSTSKLMMRLSSSKANDGSQKNNQGKSMYTDDSMVQEFSFKPYKPWKCVPKTEINEVVNQFEKMLSQFTSKSFAKSVKIRIKEFQNEFIMENYFKDLYLSRFDSPVEGTKPFNYVAQDFDHSSAQALRCIHHGKNVKEHKTVDPYTDENDGSQHDNPSKFTEVEDGQDKTKRIVEMAKKRGYLGSLFFWVMFLTVTPFIIITMTISGLITQQSVDYFEEILSTTRESFIDLGQDALEGYVHHRSNLAMSILEKPVRDLHVLTRYSGWLLSDAIKRVPDTSPEIKSKVEECKQNGAVCEQVCDCSWSDVRSECSEHTNSRNIQIPFFLAQSQDVWSNGDRNSTSYPSIATSPQSTEWFSNLSSLPGYNVGSSASGYETTFDRIGSLSAIPIYVPLYNQDNGKERVQLGSYVGFEADGSIMGYEGCANPGHSSASSHIITSHPDLPPNLCPEGKYGYDARCRYWYQKGKMMYETKNAHLYITPQYSFADEVATYGQSATSPLIDPVQGEYIGQTIIDFTIMPVLDTFSEEKTSLREGGFSILISSDKSVDTDTLVHPEFDFDNPASIGDLMYANDPNCKNDVNATVNEIDNCYRESFDAIVTKMKAGDSGVVEFQTTSENGKTEVFEIAYHPIKVKSFHPIDISDFSRGVSSTELLTLSAALIEPENSLLNEFTDTKAQLNLLGTVPFVVIICLVLLAACWFICISYRMAASIAEPMLYLLELIGKINDLDSYGNTFEIETDSHGHSLEVVNVSRTIESLYNVIGSANVAFFAGDLQKAYNVLTDVLQMYKRLDNKKGISIASNNLGNTMLTMYRTMKKSGLNRVCGFNKQQLIVKGTGYFHEAIQLGEKAYDDFYEAQGWSPICLEFMQHLSNRYFNRALFLLTVRDDHRNPQEIEQLGLRDLEIARDLDLEIVEEGKQAGWGVRTLDKLFEVTLSRVRGHLSLLEMGYPDEWEISETIDGSFKTVQLELSKQKKKPGYASSLFSDITPAGRMQQIETELMRYKMIKGDIDSAAKIAIRMLIEDDYTLLNAQLMALKVLSKYLDLPSASKHQAQEERKSKFLAYRDKIKAYAQANVMISAATGSTESSNQLSSESRDLRTLKESSRGDLVMEVF